jgi:hypothetical protein
LGFGYFSKLGGKIFKKKIIFLPAFIPEVPVFEGSARISFAS